MNYVPSLSGFHIQGASTLDELQLRRELVAAREFGMIEKFEVERMSNNDFHIWFTMHRYADKVAMVYCEHMQERWGRKGRRENYEFV